MIQSSGLFVSVKGMRRWPRGKAVDCNSSHVGSNPILCSMVISYRGHYEALSAPGPEFNSPYHRHKLAYFNSRKDGR